MTEGRVRGRIKGQDLGRGAENVYVIYFQTWSNDALPMREHQPVYRSNVTFTTCDRDAPALIGFFVVVREA
jgi:hypothetical protein